MDERIQPGGRVDKETYERFKEFVKNYHGSIRGNLGRELEKAMSERMQAAEGPDSIDRIERDVATIKAIVADADSDGGDPTPTPIDDESARTRDLSKPAANQPRGEKIEWIIDEMGFNYDGGSVHPDALRNIIEAEYNFKGETVDEYINAIVTKLDAQTIDDDVYYWGQAIDDRYAELEDEADDELETIA